MGKVDEVKVVEARYLIIIPILVTVVCAVIDTVANISHDYYKCMNIYEIAENISRCIIGYFFPSLISIVVVMLWQRRFERTDIYGIKPDRVEYGTMITVFLGLFYIVCLMLYCLVVAIIFIICMGIYCKCIYSCLNDEIKVKRKEDKTQEDLLTDFCSRDQ